MDLSTYKSKNNVIYLTEEQKIFSNLYVKVREIENRLLTDDDVAILPYLKRNEWVYREKSTERFKDYIYKKNGPLKILDIGCGNGWFTNMLAEVLSEENEVYGIDLNKIELEQAARVFIRENLSFMYGDIFKINDVFDQAFDIITLNSSAQYFDNFKKLKETLLNFLQPNGELHIIDSPFYQDSKINDAKQRSLKYYNKLGFPEMSKHYFHHSKNDVQGFETLYRPHHKIINKVLKIKDSPFSWVRLTKQ